MNKGKNERKGFFKLTRIKVSLSIFIIVIILVLGYVFANSFRLIGDVIYPNPTVLTLVIIFAWPFFLILPIASQTQIGLGSLIALATIMEIFYIYILSCVIVGIYGKLKGKK